MSKWVTVDLSEGELLSGALSATSANGLALAVARLADGSVVAFDDRCTHEECSPSDGDLDGERVVCLCHGSA